MIASSTLIFIPIYLKIIKTLLNLELGTFFRNFESFATFLEFFDFFEKVSIFLELLQFFWEFCKFFKILKSFGLFSLLWLFIFLWKCLKFYHEKKTIFSVKFLKFSKSPRTFFRNKFLKFLSKISSYFSFIYFSKFKSTKKRVEPRV